MKKTILIFGDGYVSTHLTQALCDQGWVVYKTGKQAPDHPQRLSDQVIMINFYSPALPALIKASDAILSTVPPQTASGTTGIDPVLEKYCGILAQETFTWIGYLSATSVYGDHQGKWVTEKSFCNPSNEKSNNRLLAENQWTQLFTGHAQPVHIFRLSGIYGPGRNCLESIAGGKDFTIIKKNHCFSRIHVDDICLSLLASLAVPTPGEIYNVSDDDPAPLHHVHQYAAHLLDKSALTEIPLAEANLSSQALNFFHDHKKVSNKKITATLHLKWHYPHYRVGLEKGCLRP